MILKFWGTRGGYPTEQQMTCLQFTTDRANILLDLGSSAIFKHPETISAVNTVLISHLHSDHVLMLPHFILSRLRQASDDFDPAHCPIYAPESIRGLMEAGAFPGDWITASPQVPAQIGDVRVETLVTRHTRPCWAYKLRADGQTVVVSGDTAWFDGFAEFASGADWLICECTYPDSDQERAQVYGHMTPGDVVRVMDLTHPMQTVLYHFDMLGPKDCVKAVQKHLGEDCLPVLAARDGMELEL